MYSIWATPEPPSEALRVMVTGTLPCQTPQPPVHEMPVLGAAESATTVNGVSAESIPAPFVTWTFSLPDGAEAEESKV